jgi:hypothetical protein
MAKSTSNNGESKARKTPARRKADKANADVNTQAADRATSLDTSRMSLKDADFNPSPAEIQRRAYELYVQRGGGHGRDLEDWLAAERQLKRQQGR